MTVFEIYKKIAKGEWSMMDTEQFLAGYNRRGLALLRVELIYMKHSLDPVQKKLIGEPGASNRFKAFEHRVDMLLEHKERVYLLSKERLSDQTKQIIKTAPWLSKEGRLDLPLDEIPPQELALLNGMKQAENKLSNEINQKILIYADAGKKQNKEQCIALLTGYEEKKDIVGPIKKTAVVLRHIQGSGYLNHFNDLPSEKTMCSWIEGYRSTFYPINKKE